MLGFPNETLDQLNATFNFARQLRANSNAFNIVLPYPGTKLFEEAQSQGLLAFDGKDLDDFGYREAKYVKSDEWDFEQINAMEYDVTIETTYLNNPFLDSPEDRDYLLVDFERRLRKLPGHIIAHIVAGYVYNKKNKTAEYQKHYEAAVNLFKDKVLYDTFYKYLSLDHPIINDFNRYLKLKGIKI
jgi:hypothetical protein